MTTPNRIELKTCYARYEAARAKLEALPKKE